MAVVVFDFNVRRIKREEVFDAGVERQARERERRALELLFRLLEMIMIKV